MKTINRLSMFFAFILCTLPMTCQTVFDVGKKAVENTTTELVGLADVVFILAIVVEFIIMLAVHDSKRKLGSLIILILTILAYVGIKLSQSGVVTNTVNKIFGLTS